MEILNCLAEAKRPMALQELATRLGWAKSTVHGLVSALREYGMIEQSTEDGKYRLGVRLFELGSAVSSSWDILSVARPHMQNIAMQTGEPVYLGMLERGEVLYLDHVDTGSAFRVIAEAGARVPAHCSALGKAMLAYLPQVQVKGLFAQGIQSLTPHTITTLEEMEAELQVVRERGYAIEDGEMRIGLRGIAVPVFNVRKEAVYAIGVTGMFRRITDETFLLAGKLAVEAALHISHQLGYRP